MLEPYQKLECEFEKWANVSNVVACSSGTAALHLALEALRLPLGSLVVVPNFAMIACARAVTLAGHEPVFIECDTDLNLDPNVLREYHNVARIYPGQGAGSIMAVIAVHTYGRQCRMDEIHDALYPFKVAVIEDLAEAHGVSPHPKTDVGCWSFYKNKIIAGEEGGAAYFIDPRVATVARQLRTLGFTDKHDFNHIPRGHNYRMSNAHAKLILDSLAKADENIQQRRVIEKWYDEECPSGWRMPKRTVPWVYDFRIPGMTYKQQDRIVIQLQEEGIAARHAFKPLNSQQEYREWIPREGTDELDSETYKASREVIYLPIIPGVTTKDLSVKSFEVLRGISTGYY